jgi:hypothetical protein
MVATSCRLRHWAGASATSASSCWAAMGIREDGGQARASRGVMGVDTGMLAGTYLSHIHPRPIPTHYPANYFAEALTAPRRLSRGNANFHRLI